jgi:outer membrane protein OmpA-like peptidoglycan-associated protein
MRTRIAIVPFLLALTSGAHAQDVEGSKDHPIITRYPGSTIEWYVVDNHRPFRFPVGPVTGYRQIDDWADTEGLVTRIYYELNNSGRTFSEVFRNYRDALAAADFDILAEGVHEGSGGNDVGGRSWQGVFFAENPFGQPGPVNAMVSGSASSGGRGTVIATRDRATGTAYVAVSVYQFRDTTISTLIDIVEAAAAETGLVTVNAQAIGAGITENGRVVLDGVFFEYDEATLTPSSRDALEQIAIYLRANQDKRFYVVGHTDAQGTFAYNENLSRARARAVVQALIDDFGIGSDRLEPYGVGPLVPVFSNASDAGRERNRRVELVER